MHLQEHNTSKHAHTYTRMTAVLDLHTVSLSLQKASFHNVFILQHIHLLQLHMTILQLFFMQTSHHNQHSHRGNLT